MSTPIDIFEVLEQGEVVEQSRDYGVIATWNGSTMVRLFASLDTGDWIEVDVVTLGCDFTDPRAPSPRLAAESAAARLIDAYAGQFDRCPECGATDPFEPAVKDCSACREAAADVVEGAERAAGWSRSP